MTYEYVPVPSERVLALDPATFGFGYAVLEYEPLRLVAWGTKTGRRNNGTVASAVNRLIFDYQPTVIVLPSWPDGGHSLRGPALDAFVDAIEETLTSHGLPVLMCSPADVREHFASVGATTKYEIAEHLTDEFPELHAILPRPRENTQTERAAMTVFDAVALTLATCPASEPPSV
jgi:RNase H-fold protein (predicted Holliday junction resolvase)